MQETLIKVTGEAHVRVVSAEGIVKIDNVVKNLVVNAGLTAIVNRLANISPASDCIFGYISVGTSSTTPAAGDTQLGAEVARKAITSRANSTTQAAVSATFNAGDIPGTPVTIAEAGIFIDGTGTLNSGTLFSHLPLNVTVQSTDSLFIDWRITLASA